MRLKDTQTQVHLQEYTQTLLHTHTPTHTHTHTNSYVYMYQFICLYTHIYKHHLEALLCKISNKYLMSTKYHSWTCREYDEKSTFPNF